MPKHSIKRLAKQTAAKDAADRKRWMASDSFQNFSAGLGIGTSNQMTASTYGFNPITRIRTLLEWIHRGSWLGGIAVDLVADDMTKAGVDILGDLEPEDMQEINQAATELKIWESTNQTIKWARLYGGAIAVVLIDGQDVSKPLRVESVGAGQFKGLLVLDRWMVEPSLNDMVTDLGPDLGRIPKFYRVNTTAPPGFYGQNIHYSRCLRLEGIRLPYWQAMMENMWGISVLERLYDRMVAFDSATTGAAQLAYKAYIRTYKVKDLRQIVAAGGDGLLGLQKYINFMRQTQGIEGLTLLDAEDEFEAHETSAFSGLSDVILQLGQQLGGSLQIPLVRLFGESPAGLNSTGESDLRTYYDGINQQQNANLLWPLTKIYCCIARSRGIAIDESFGIKFRPLWQLTETEKATIAQVKTDTIMKVQESGVIGDQIVLQELRQSSEITGVWTNISKEDIEKADREPPAPEPELEEENEGHTEDSALLCPVCFHPVGPEGYCKRDH